jgi:RNA polymerase sigma-70 factor (ECF subfamily)
VSLKPLSEYTDEELIIEFKLNRTEAAFQILVKRFKSPLFNFVYRFLGDYELCSDVVQETFIRVFRNVDSYKNIGKFSTWIYTIASNLTKTEYRKIRSSKNFSISNFGQEGEDYEISDSTYRPDKMVESGQTGELIQKALLEIPEQYREMVILRDIQGLAYEEITEITGLPIGTVKSRINRGREKLQKLLKNV